jgi:ATP-dependent helicase HrpA
VCDRVATDLVSTTIDVVRRVEKVLSAAHDVQLQLPSQPPPGQADAIEDVRAQLDRLLPAGFVRSTGRAHLADLARYLAAVRRRLEQLPRGVEADRQRMARVHAVEDAYDELVRALPSARQGADSVRDIAWQIEELRVSLWAQQLGTPRPVSEQRIHKAIDAAASGR